MKERWKIIIERKTSKKT